MAREWPQLAPVTIRKRLGRTAAGTLILFAALISVGVTAPVDSPFTIDVKPVFLRLDPAASANSGASALGLDIDIKIGGLHFHYAWTAVPMAALTTPALNERQNRRTRVEESTKEPRELL